MPTTATKTKQNYLSQIRTIVELKPSAILLYGPPGIGKTSLAAAIPGVLFMCEYREDGISTLKSHKLVSSDVPILPPIQRWEEAKAVLTELASTEHPYACLAVDALGGFERLCYEYVCRSKFSGDWQKFLAYGRGMDAAVSEWLELLSGFDKLRTQGVSIFMLAHSKTHPKKNPEGDDWDREMPDMDRRTWSATHKWCDAVLYASYHVEVVEDGQGRGKGRGGHRRIIRTEWDAAYEAKNRAGLPPVIEMGASGAEAWMNLLSAMKG